MSDLSMSPTNIITLSTSANLRSTTPRVEGFPETATKTALLALTTPFVHPTPCPDVYILTSISNSGTALPILYQDITDPQFAACQPRGWRDVIPSLRQSFSPAVCPSNWGANDMSTATISGKEVSTAYCCSPGYTYLAALTSPDSYVGGVCRIAYGTQTPTYTLLSATKSDGYPQVFATGVVLHPAWHIAWEKSDLPTLFPRPPDLTSRMRIPLWTPGLNITPGEYDNNDSGRQPDGKGIGQIYMFLAVGLPLIAIVILTGCGCLCYRHRSKNKKTKEDAVISGLAAAQRERRERAEWERANGGAPPPTYSLDPIDVGRT